MLTLKSQIFQKYALLFTYDVLFEYFRYVLKVKPSTTWLCLQKIKLIKLKCIISWKVKNGSKKMIIFFPNLAKMAGNGAFFTKLC